MDDRSKVNLEDSRPSTSPYKLESSSELNSLNVSKGTKDLGSSASPNKLDSASVPNPTEDSENVVPSNPSKRPMSHDDLEDSKLSMPQSSSKYIAGEEEEEEEEGDDDDGDDDDDEEEEEEEEEEEDDDDDDDDEAMKLDSSRAPHVVLAVCESEEAVHFDSIFNSLAEFATVRTVATESAHFFIRKSAGCDRIFVYKDKHEWSTWERVGDPVIHISLVEWADIMVVAPLSVGTLGKIARGMCDDLVTCMVRAWDYRKPLFLVPSIDVRMWNKVITKQHVLMMHMLGASFITPYSTCVCKGQFGDGSMVDPSDVGLFVNVSMTEGKRNCGCPWIQ